MDKFKDCIACAEQIQANAMLCKHCKTRQDDESFKPIEKSANTDRREPMPSSLECPRCSEKTYLNAVCDRCGFKGQQQPGLADSPKKTGWGLLVETTEENQTARVTPKARTSGCPKCGRQDMVGSVRSIISQGTNSGVGLAVGGPVLQGPKECQCFRWNQQVAVGTS